MTLLTGGSPIQGREVLDDDVDLARDRVLVTRAQEGDRSAFDDLYLRYYRRLYRFCLRRLHDTHEAEDVAQEAFSRAWRALPGFGGDRRFYPWLSVIAAHLCTDVLRRRNRSTPVAEFHQNNVASTEDGGEELVLRSVDCDIVAKAFERLSERHRRILNLREGSGWSYQRIADHEGVGITAVETLLWRARQALKREFAALAGSDGRLAGWAGGLFSLSMLRRLLRGPAQLARRLGHTGSAAALAVGSAAAATAVVVTATVGNPPAPPPLPGSPSGPAAAATVAPGRLPTGGLLGASPQKMAAQRAAPSPGLSNPTPLIPSLPVTPSMAAPSVNLPTVNPPALPGVGPLVNGLGQGIGSVTSRAAAPIGGAIQTTVPNLLEGTASSAASATCSLTGSAISGLGVVSCGPSGAPGTGG